MWHIILEDMDQFDTKLISPDVSSIPISPKLDSSTFQDSYTQPRTKFRSLDLPSPHKKNIPLLVYPKEVYEAKHFVQMQCPFFSRLRTFAPTHLSTRYTKPDIMLTVVGLWCKNSKSTSSQHITECELVDLVFSVQNTCPDTNPLKRWRR